MINFHKIHFPFIFVKYVFKLSADSECRLFNAVVTENKSILIEMPDASAICTPSLSFDTNCNEADAKRWGGHGHSGIT